MTRNITVMILFFGLITACMNNSRTLSDTDKNRYLVKGDSIATDMQQMLLKNLTHAIEENGTVGALAFCNENAIPLTEEGSKAHGAEAHRLTDKNRNPNNILSTEIDKKAWSKISQVMGDKDISPKHWVGKEGDAVYYYKAIPLGMPTCLSCHGNINSDIEVETLREITMRYPNDKATGYEMGQLRGIWKVQLK